MQLPPEIHYNLSEGKPDLSLLSVNIVMLGLTSPLFSKLF